MGTSYLPIDDTWKRYIQDAKETYNYLEDEMKSTLMQLAEDSCRSFRDKRSGCKISWKYKISQF